MSKAKETAIATVDSSRYLTTQGGMTAAAASLAASGERLSAGDLLRVPGATGGATSWEVEGVSGPESIKSITGLMVGYHQCGVLWPSIDPTPDCMPVMRTWDLKTGEQVGPIPADMAEGMEACRIDERHFNWEACPFNQWGTGRNGIGKRCREQRMILMLREGDVLPLVLTCQPGSLRRVVRFVKSLGLQARIPYYRAIVEWTLERATNKTGQPYSQLAPKLVGTISEDEGMAVLKQWVEPLRSIITSVNPEPDVDAGGDES